LAVPLLIDRFNITNRTTVREKYRITTKKTDITIE